MKPQKNHNWEVCSNWSLFHFTIAVDKCKLFFIKLKEDCYYSTSTTTTTATTTTTTAYPNTELQTGTSLQRYIYIYTWSVVLCANDEGYFRIIICTNCDMNPYQILRMDTGKLVLLCAIITNVLCYNNISFRPCRGLRCGLIPPDTTVSFKI